MNYSVVYDAIEAGQPAGDYVGLAIWVAVAIAVAVLLSKKCKTDANSSVAFLAVFLAGWFLVGGFGYWNIFFKQHRCEQWLANGRYVVSEGIVEDFDPMPWSGHKHESFGLDGYRFEYSDFDRSNGCFNRTRSHGGPIYNGRKIRVFHNDGVILRIEAAGG